jgi:hypothetical protein
VSSSTNLMKYDQARNALAEARTLSEVKDIADKHTALEEYARRANDKDMEIWCGQMRVRAERKFGELSKLLDNTSKGGRPKTNRSSAGPVSKTKVLTDLGVTKQHANRCEKLADIPEEKFEVQLAQVEDRIKNPPKRKRTRRKPGDLRTDARRRKPPEEKPLHPNRAAYFRAVEIRMSVFTGCKEIEQARCTPEQWLDALHPAQFDAIPEEVFPIIDWLTEVRRLYETRRGKQATSIVGHDSGARVQGFG